MNLNINPNDWIVYRGGYRSAFHVAKVVKATAVRVKISNSSYWDRTTKREDVVHVTPSREAAEDLKLRLMEPIDAFEKAKAALDAEHAARVTALRHEREQAIKSILPSQES